MAAYRLVVSLLACLLRAVPARLRNLLLSLFSGVISAAEAGGNLIVSINADPRTFNRLLAFDINSAMIPGSFVLRSATHQ